MNLRVAFALTVTLLLLLLVGCSQEQVTQPETGYLASDYPDPEVLSPEENLGRIHKAADTPITDRFIVQFRPDVADASALAGSLAGKYGLSVPTFFQYAIKGFPARMSPETAEALRSEPSVLEVTLDQWVRTVAQEIPTGVDRIDTELNPFAAIDGVPTNVDVDIAIVDTGLDTTHPALNIAGGRTFLGGLSFSSFMDDNGHGTHVAGIAAARDDTLDVVGVAPGARLWGVKVLNAAGTGLVSDVILGLDWILARSTTIEVVNLSFAAVGWSNPLNNAINNCVAAGLVVVASAGNEGVDIFGADGTIGTADDVIPAACPGAATISALVDTDGLPGGLGAASTFGPDDSFATFSNFSASSYIDNPVTSPGQAIDLILPGVDINSTRLGGGTILASGTSQAAPHAAGLFALYIAENGRPTDTAGVAAARQALIDNGPAQDSPLGLATANDPDGSLENLGWAVEPQLLSDVAFLEFSAPATVFPGDTLDMRVRIANVGNVDITTPFQAWIGVQGTSVELARATVPGLPAGASMLRVIHFNVPAKDLAVAVNPGTYTLFVTHDFSDPNPGNDLLTTDVELLAPPEFGTVVVNPDPNALNAPWTIDSPLGTFNFSGDLTRAGVPTGNYTITWGDVAGWITPAPETLALTVNDTITFNGVYTEIPTTGTIVINPDPDALGAPWSLEGPGAATYAGSGDSTMVDMPTGDYTVTWGEVAGWNTPAGETLALAGGGTATFDGLYTEIGTTGTVVVDAVPNALNAPWTITGPIGVFNGTGDRTRTDLPIGDYTIAWGEVA
ncbi:MAG: S8 family serine peptidase, partial [bacterium]